MYKVVNFQKFRERECILKFKTFSILEFHFHLRIYLKTEENQEILCRDGRSQEPPGCTLTSSEQSGN
jgi:hypothetical protein